MKRFAIVFCRELASFLRWPVGYILNFLLTAALLLQEWLPAPLHLAMDHPMVWIGETFCLHDGVQDDYCPLVPSWLVTLNCRLATWVYGENTSVLAMRYYRDHYAH